ncbi:MULTISPECIES: ATP-binding protein [unclassified Exiguobacterium]|uniref:ATP-binding protein n=1 Tax=unclassified Exiguobacterium TaxID=2644629 RepID=UPI001BEC09B1|nr:MULTISPECIES: ATP-binding protein [unclassified Exiguobacterium]
MRTWLNRTIGRQIMSAFYIILAMLLLTSAGVYFYTKQQVQEAKQELATLNEHRTNATNLYESWQSLQYEMRGFVLLGDDEMLEEIKTKQQNIDQQTTWFEKNAAFTEEEQYANDARELYDAYTTRVMPSLINYVDAKKDGEVEEPFLQMATLGKVTQTPNLDEDRKFNIDTKSAADMSSSIVDMETVFTDYRNSLNEKELAAQNRLGTQVNSSQVLGLINLAVLLFIIVLFVRPFVAKITRQLRQLNRESSRLAKGEDASPIEVLNAKDEIGELTTTFNLMAASISNQKSQLVSSNDELQSQQEELVAQQEELQTQQEELEEALDVTLRNETHLRYRNELTETLASRETLTAYPAIIEKLISITDAEFGAIVFLDEDEYTDIVSYGMTVDQERKLLTSSLSLLERARMHKKAVRSTKQVTSDHPLPYPYSMYETVVPVMDPSTNMMIASIYLVRYRDQFNEDQTAEIWSFSRQLALSLLRMRVFDEIEREREKTSKLLHSIREAVMYIEEDRIFANRPLLALFHHPAHDQFNDEGLMTLDVKIEELAVQVDQHEAFLEYMNQVCSHQVPTESLSLSLNKEERFVTLYAEGIHYGGRFRGTMLVLRDVTVETEVDRMKSEFVSTVSHELRTPLASIFGYTELMLAKELTPNRQQRYLETIHAETERLTGLVNDFLDVQRMESSQQHYHFKELDVVAMIREIAEFQVGSSQTHTVLLETDDAAVEMIQADEQKMRQLFGNLINNAIKYSPDGGAITIGIEPADDLLRIRIQDEGIGIPRHALPELFSKFYRVDNSDSRKIGGTGLGLAICQEIVRAHEGMIHVDSTEGAGSSFTVELPIIQENPTALSPTLEITDFE